MFAESEARLCTLGLVCSLQVPLCQSATLVEDQIYSLYVHCTRRLAKAPLFAESKARLRTLGLVCTSPCVNKENATLVEDKIYFLHSDRLKITNLLGHLMAHG